MAETETTMFPMAYTTDRLRIVLMQQRETKQHTIASQVHMPLL
jgi:hypothetical protein